MSLLAPAARSPAPPRPAARAEAGTELPFSDEDFARIAAFSLKAFGLSQSGDKKQLVHARLTRLLRECGCPDIPTLLTRLENDPDCPERKALISALTTNVTAFFREPHHFRQFSEDVVRPRLDSLRRGGRLRVWSAGCSAGQEPFSVAMTLLDLLPEAPRLNIRILATDIDPPIIRRAREASYSGEELTGLTPGQQAKLMHPLRGGALQVNQDLRAMIRFAELNLIEPWPMRGPFDAIFCRNVAIYFDKPTQSQLWSRFAQMLAPGGFLFIGHSERVSGPACESLISAGITAYRLTPPSERARK